jgi:hypothetical protein
VADAQRSVRGDLRRNLRAAQLALNRAGVDADRNEAGASVVVPRHNRAIAGGIGEVKIA